MVRKRWRTWVLTAVCVVLVLLVWDLRDSHHTLKGVSDMVCSGETVYLIDNEGEAYHFFRLDGLGRMTGKIRMPKLVGTWWNVYDNLSIDTDGSVYVYEYSKNMVRNESRSTVLRCNFQNGTLEKAWELPAQKLLRVEVTGGLVYYPASINEKETGFYRLQTGGEPELCGRIPVPYSHMVNVWYDPEQGALCSDWLCRFYRSGKEPLKIENPERDYANVSAGPAGITYMDLKEGWVRQLGFHGQGTRNIMRIENIRLMKEGHGVDDIFPFHFEEDGSFCAGIDKSSGSRVAGKFDETGRQVLEFEKLTLAPANRLIHDFKALLFIWIFLAVWRIAADLFLRRSKGVVPIVLKLMGILIPVFLLGGLVINNQIEVSLRERIVRINHDLLYLMADRLLSQTDASQFCEVDPNLGVEDLRYQGIFSEKAKSGLSREIFNVKDSETEPVVANTYQWIFLKEQGDYRYLKVDGKHYFGNLVRYDRDRLEMDKIEEAYRRGAVIKTEYNDFTGDFLALYLPIKNRQGEMVGVMESGMNIRIVFYEVEKQMHQIRTNLMFLMCLLCTVLCAVLGTFLNPIRRLKTAVEDVSTGNLGRTVSVRGRDEVAGIARAFNRMSVLLKEQVAYIQLCSDRYAAFVPKTVFTILNREDITRVRLGDQNEIMAAVLEVGSARFRQMARSLDGNKLYRMINDMLAEMIPIVVESEGVVDHMKEDGITVYYPDGARSALSAAVTICQHLNALREEKPELPRYCIALNFGPVRVGIVGGEQRMAATTIAEIMTMAGFYNGMAEKYGCRILAPGALAKNIPGFEQDYHVRKLGYVFLKATGTLEPVYDVYDGDEAGEFRLKAETAELFSQALTEYLAGSYYEARLKFAQILRRNPKDEAARVYVYRCDAFCREEDGQEMTAWLEQYG